MEGYDAQPHGGSLMHGNPEADGPVGCASKLKCTNTKDVKPV